MDPFGFNPALPFPVPAATINLEFPNHSPAPMAAHQIPAYPEMIKAAIGALNEAYGSSKQAISEYIERGYENLPPSHSEELAAWLQALKSNGEIVQINQSFRLPGFSLLAALGAPPAPGGASAHRKRGRPRKLKPTTEPNFELSVEPVNEGNGVQVEAVEVVPEKRAGRPVKRFEVEGSNGAVEKKGRGRPKINKKAVLSGPLGYPKRSPGRPPKSRSVADVFDGPVKTSAVVGVKKRGRPKKSPGDVLVPKVLKMIGARPSDVGSRVFGPVDPQWMVGYAQVREKLDYIQSKMREAIGVIKPHLMNQIMTNGHIGTALQELDQISTMDVMAVSLTDPGKFPEETAETQFY